MTVLFNQKYPSIVLAALACACSGGAEGDVANTSPLVQQDTSTPRAAAPVAETNEAAETASELPASNDPAETAEATAETASDLANTEPSSADPLPSDCATPAGVSGRPESVSELLELINALPSPVTIACLVESLERPLDLFMTSSTFSAQPAFYDSPRTFIFSGPLVLSIVPGGSSSTLLEYGLRTVEARSIKGEIEFPIVDEVTEETLLDRIRLSQSGSVCGGCHAAEQRLDNQPIDAAYESVIIVPNPMYEVDIETFRERTSECDWQLDGPRCEILAALFEHGEVRRTELWQ